MMRNLLGISLMLVAIAGCGIKATVVTPLNPQDVLDGQALTVMLSRVEPIDRTDDKPDDNKPAQCLCGGTGRSGDGLGPCACPDGCKCKLRRAESETAAVPETPAEQQTPQQEVEELQPAEFVPVETDKVAEQIDELSEGQSKLESELASVTERIKALEAKIEAKAIAPDIKPTGFTEEQAQTRRPSVQVVLVCRDYCQPCVQQEQQIQKLEGSGWRIGSADDSHVIKVMNTDATNSDMVREAQEIAKQAGYPTMCFFKDGKFVSAVTGLTAATEIADRLNEIWTGKPSTSQSETVTQTTTVVERLPVVQTPWGMIDLETYQRNCNCSMCNGIRALQAQYRQQSTVTVASSAVAAAQAPTPGPAVDQMLEALQLSSADVLADLGCGDGRILIAACKRFGCSAVGVEIDEAKAQEARKAVEAAGMSSRIEIVTGDARQFDPAKYGVTAITAYLYPDLLQELRPIFASVPVVVTPFHAVPGMEMQQKGDIWIKDRRSAVVPATARRTVPAFMLSV